MTHYLIEFRVRGYAKRYAKKVIYDVSRKFKVRGMTGKRKVVPHITLFGPFTTKNQKKMVNAVQSICEKYDRIFFSYKGFNYFDNKKNKVIYMDIFPSADLKKFRYDLASVLRKVTSTKSSEDRKSKDKFKFHSTIAFKDIDKKFDRIWNYIKRKKNPNIRQTLLRVTILKNSRILYEYDFLQKRLLNRRESLSKREFGRTIKKLKKPSSEVTKHRGSKKIGIFQKIIRWLR